MATERSQPGDDAAEATTETESERADVDAGDDPYVIRPYEARDREGFLDLYDLVLGDRNDEWFRWKYEENPYADHVPIVLATFEGEVVGTKPCFALELRAGDRRLRGFQPADVMVHPDHRRRGLYSRTTERMKERYRDRDPSLFFNFPNEATLNGSLKHGWRIVEEVPTFYRVQHPDALIGDGADDRLRLLAKLSRGPMGLYLRGREATAPRTSGVTVERFDDVPVGVFVDLYERSVPPTLHANRNETFYGWRFENPKWEYDAYVARRGGEPIAGVIAGTQVRDGALVTCLTDVVPLAEADGRREGLVAIVERIVEDERDADLLAASGRAVPRDLLARFGFRSDESPPLSEFTVRTTQVTYPIAADDGHEWTVADRAIADPRNWTVTFAEQDTR
ncbi:GNAT family N-acetyltransferase [Salinilacihabitans rarus]|uniref:GNAT family N-acetyltransferase n=1 Tax=Salinilacihabitans rarus TaxID=2961596 RepID=UPI0020C8B86B|nr:GNAT family N-acetyltransferase [Salinilacihabitans rarus]